MRRPPFDREIKRDARKLGRLVAGTMAFRVRHFYQMPPTDERWLSMTTAQVQIEYFAILFAANPNLPEVDETTDFEAQVAQMEEEATLAGLNPMALSAAPPDPGDFDDEVAALDLSGGVS